MIVPRLLNSTWMLRCLPGARAFHCATRDVARCQSDLLLAMLQRNRDTDIGREYGFGALRSVAEYQQRVPLATYESHAARIGQIAGGASRVLTEDPVTLFEPTSGTSSGRKLIPWTTGLGRQFQAAITPWIADLLGGRPAVRAGRAYWSVSPALGPREVTESGIPIGFEDDTAYLGLAERLLANRLLAVPSSVARIPDPEAFRYATLRHLVEATDLSLISVWSPTFLCRLLEPLERLSGQLAHDLRDRAALRRILLSPASTPEKLHQLWPGLTLVSCWADGSAASFVPELKRLLPWVEVQPKGLIATEGCVSIPLLGEPGAALALRSHFLEFIPREGGPSGGAYLAHELELGGQYHVVLTTAGGLYRYQLFDVVEVVGFKHACPLVRFLGRSNGTCDLVGEKLEEVHVQRVLEQSLGALGIEIAFALLVPVAAATPPRYRLYLQLPRWAAGILPALSLGEAMQRGLEENPYYRHAVQMKQLGPLEIRELPSDGPTGAEYLERAALARGQKLGDMKPRVLDDWADWEELFSSTRFARRG